MLNFRSFPKAIAFTGLVACLIIALNVAPFSAVTHHVIAAIDSLVVQHTGSLADQLQAALADTVYAEEMPGAVLYLSTGKTTWMGAAGVSNLANKTPMRAGDRFSIASTSKTFVAVVALQLVQSGQLALDQAIASYLPADVSPHIANSDRITVRQLLNHTSGVAEYLETDGFAAATATRSRVHPWTAREAIEYIFDAPPKAEPGATYAYTDSNYILLELIIETLTGNPLMKVTRDRILTPLRLNNTFTELWEAVPGGLADGYSKANWAGKRQSYNDRNLGNGLGDGGLVSIATDLATFIRTLLTSQTLLSPAILHEMLTFVDTGGGTQYGLGIQRWNDPNFGILLGHSGNYYGFQSLMLYLPRRKITVVALTNSEDADANKIVQAGLTVINRVSP